MTFVCFTYYLLHYFSLLQYITFAPPPSCITTNSEVVKCGYLKIFTEFTRVIPKTILTKTSIIVIANTYSTLEAQYDGCGIKLSPG